MSIYQNRKILQRKPDLNFFQNRTKKTRHLLHSRYISKLRLRSIGLALTSKYRLKDIVKILLYLAATVILGALFAPPLYWAGQSLLHVGATHGLVNFHENHATGPLAFLSQQFRRYFDRAILVAAFALLWPLGRSLQIRKLNELGLQPDPARWRHFCMGLFISMTSVIILGAIALQFGGYAFVTPIPWIKIALLPISAVVVAVIEETLFRGVLQGLVRSSNKIAFLFVPALYAIVHFLKPPGDAFSQTQITWDSGFVQTRLALWQFTDLKLVAGGFLTLFLVGIILAYARQKTRALWLPIGLHAGWIIAKMGFTKIASGNGHGWPWFGVDLLTGLAPVLVLFFTGIVIWLWLRPIKST